jgi:hypothetical protein
MKMIKMVGLVLIAGFVIAIGSQIGDLFSPTGKMHLVPTAEARFGRPLTPVSVAGVARRSVRRCAVGVYRCNLPDAQASFVGFIGEACNANI